MPNWKNHKAGTYKVTNLSTRSVERDGRVYKPGEERVVELPNGEQHLRLSATKALRVEPVKGNVKAADAS